MFDLDILLVVYVMNKLRKLLLSKTGYALYVLLTDHFDQFGVTKYVLRHKPSSAEFWVSNGGWFFDGREGNAGTIGLIERHYLYVVFRRQQNKRLAQVLSQT